MITSRDILNLGCYKSDGMVCDWWFFLVSWIVWYGV